MGIKTKAIKIGNKEVTIIQFDALEALKLRKDLVGSVKGQLGDSVSLGNGYGDILKAVASLIYEIPEDMFIKLFKNCSAEGLGLGDAEHFNNFFSDNLDGPLELAMEVLELNGFFSLNTLSLITKRVPMLAPMGEAIKQFLKDVKKG